MAISIPVSERTGRRLGITGSSPRGGIEAGQLRLAPGEESAIGDI
jgi:hypothetical protein